MKPYRNICMLLFSIILMICCDTESDIENIEVYEIPDEAKCIFSEGDIILYDCNDGSIDSVYLRMLDTWTETFTGIGWFGEEYTSHIEFQRIIFESSNDNWKEILRNNFTSPGIETRCYIIETTTIYRDSLPYCYIYSACEPIGGLIISESWVEYNELSFNNKSYNKVYFDSKGDMINGFEIYWNLAYGIIRFVAYSDGISIIWDIEGSV